MTELNSTFFRGILFWRNFYFLQEKMASDNYSDSDSDSESESIIQDTMVLKPPESTQTVESSTISYAWVILFTMCVDEEEPFTIVRLTQFKNSDFPWEVITGELGSKERNRVRKFNNIEGQSFCIFAKIEHGKFLFNKNRVYGRDYVYCLAFYCPAVYCPAVYCPGVYWVILYICYIFNFKESSTTDVERLLSVWTMSIRHSFQSKLTYGESTHIWCTLRITEFFQSLNTIGKRIPFGVEGSQFHPQLLM